MFYSPMGYLARLTLKAPITTAADNICQYFFYCFSALFPKKDKNKKIKCHLLQFLVGALRVNVLNVPPIFLWCTCIDVGWLVVLGLTAL